MRFFSAMFLLKWDAGMPMIINDSIEPTNQGTNSGCGFIRLFCLRSHKKYSFPFFEVLAVNFELGRSA